MTSVTGMSVTSSRLSPLAAAVASRLRGAVQPRLRHTVRVFVAGFILLQFAGIPAAVISTYEIPVMSDFAPVIDGARLLKADPACLYCLKPQIEMQQQMGIMHPNDPTWAVFTDPPLAALVSSPLAGLALREIILVFAAISITLLIVAGALMFSWLPSVWSRRERIVAVLFALGFGTVINLRSQQWGAVQIFACAAAFFLIRRRANFSAGLVLAICLVKVQLFWLVAPALIIGRHYRVAAGFLLGGLVWAGTTVMLIGFDGLSKYPSIASIEVTQARYADGLSGFIAHLVQNNNVMLAIMAACSVVCVVAMWWIRASLRSSSAELAIVIGLAASFVCAPHQWWYDTAVLAPALLVWVQRHRPTGFVAAVLVSAASVHLYTLAFIGPGLLTLAILGLRHESIGSPRVETAMRAISSSPLRTVRPLSVGPS